MFICYAGPDKSFADEILHYLEKAPYYMKVCIDYRDFLPGADLLETAAKAIEERCNKVLLILSENFHKCEVADFQAKIALSLSPGLFLKPLLISCFCCIFCSGGVGGRSVSEKVEVARGRLVSLDRFSFAFRAKNGEWRDSHLGFQVSFASP